MCQPIPTGLCARWDFDSEASIFTPRPNKTLSFENLVMSYFERTRPEGEFESFFKTGRQKKNDCFSVDGFCSRRNSLFEALACFYLFCPCQELLPSLTEEDIQSGCKKRELVAWRRLYKQEKGFKVIEMWECEWRRLYKTTNIVKQHMRENFPYRHLLARVQLLEEIKEGKLFSYVQCDIEVPKKLRSKFNKFPQIFKISLVNKSDIRNLIKNYAEEQRLLSRPHKKLITSFTLQNGTLITLLLSFYLQLVFVCTKTHRFVEYTSKKCFNSFVQSAVGARRQSDENRNSSVVAETLKLLANRSYGYQIMDRSRHTVTKCLTDEKTHAASNRNLFKKLDLVNNSLCEVELAKAQI